MTRLQVEMLKKELLRKSKYEEYFEWSTIPVKKRTRPQMNVTQLMKNRKYLDACFKSLILTPHLTSRKNEITAGKEN